MKRISPDTPIAVLFCCFVVLGFDISHFPSPILVTPGESRIAFFLDFHLLSSNNGSCGAVNPKSVPIVLGTVNLVEQIQVKTNLSVGISFYDVCGSVATSLLALSRVLVDMESIPTVFITMTSPDVTTALSGVLRHLNVQHVSIGYDHLGAQTLHEDNFHHLQERNFQFLSLSMPSRVKAALKLLKLLGVTYFTLAVYDNRLARSEANYLQMLVDQVDTFCVVKLSTPAASHATVIFTGDGQTGDVRAPVVDRESKVVVVVGDDAIGVSNDARQTVLWLRESVHLPDGDLDTVLQINQSFSAAIPHSLLCDSYHLDNAVPQDDNDEVTHSAINETCLIHLHTLRQVLVARTAVGLLVAKLASAGINTSLEETIVSLQEIHSSWPGVKLPFLEQKSQFRVEELGANFKKNEKMVNNVYTFERGTITLPAALLDRGLNTSCDVNCHLCHVCKPKMSSGKTIDVPSTIASKTVLMVGLFPLQTSGTSLQRDCSIPNESGMDAASSFISAIENYKKRNGGNILRHINLGAVILDTCQHENNLRHYENEIEMCYSSYKNNSGGDVVITPSSVIGYVAFDPTMADQSDFRKILLKVTDSAYSVYTDPTSLYLSHVTRALSTIEWTCMTLVLSEDNRILSQVKNIFQSSGLCVDSYFTVTSPMHIPTIGQTIAGGRGRQFPIVFLTSPSTTLQILEDIASRTQRIALKCVFTTWNSDVISFASVFRAADTFVLVTPSLSEDSVVITPDNQTGSLWQTSDPAPVENNTKSLRGRFGRTRTLMNFAVDSLVLAIDAVYKELCPSQAGVCKSMDVFADIKDKLVQRLRQTKRDPDYDIVMGRHTGYKWQETVIGTVGHNGAILLNNESRSLPKGRCPDWNPPCFSCSSSVVPPVESNSSISDSGVNSTLWSQAKRPFIYLPGDVLVTGIFPLRRSGPESFQCGDLLDTTGEERSEQAFMFAVDTARRRYINLLPGVMVGGLLLDSCSDISVTLQALGDFQSCRMEFVGANDLFQIPPPSPLQVIGYVLHDSVPDMPSLRGALMRTNKMVIVSSASDPSFGFMSRDSPSRLTVDAVLSLFALFQWKHTILVTSVVESFQAMADYFLAEAKLQDVCLVQHVRLSGDPGNALNDVGNFSNSSSFIPVVLLVSRAEAVNLFRNQSANIVTRPWVISTIEDNWLSNVGINIPWGALLIDVVGKVNADFELFIETFSTGGGRLLSPWWKTYLRERFKCHPAPESASTSALPGCEENPLDRGPLHPSAAASRVISNVDSILHALDARHKKACPGINGICRNMSSDILGGRLRLSEANFQYEGGELTVNDAGIREITLSITSHQPGKLVTVGTYRTRALSVNMSAVHFFSSRGHPLSLPSYMSVCPGCTCVNPVTRNATDESVAATDKLRSLPEGVYFKEPGVFLKETWALPILVLAVTGASMALIFVLFVLLKVCQGALARRYLGLGFVLLVSFLLLYLSSLPFVFTPSHAVCGLRYLLPAVAYCLTFACVLVKLMALQDYRRIGLGGELSGFNQGLSVFFIMLVQISISVQWWVFKEPFLLQVADPQDGVVKYACDFERKNFVLYLTFVIFLTLLCAFYSATVRKDKQNVGEAKLLLVFCWTALLFWLCWVAALLVLDARHAPLVVSCAIVATATTGLVVVFVPKVRLVARLRYDLARKHGARNGYSVDTEFLYERPYSLPGTLTSNYSTIRTYPKSVAINVDSSLSY